MAGNLLGSSNGANKAYKFNGFSSSTLASFTATGNFATTEDASGNAIYTSDVNTSAKNVKKGTGFTATVQSSFNADATADVYDMTFDASGNLVTASSSVGKIKKFTGFTSTVSDSFIWTYAVTNTVRGVCFTTQSKVDLYLGSGGTPEIALTSGFSSTIQSSTTGWVAAGATGLAEDGTLLYTNDRDNAKFLSHVGNTTTVNSSTAYPSGMTAAQGMDWEFPAAAASTRDARGLTLLGVG